MLLVLPRFDHEGDRPARIDLDQRRAAGWPGMTGNEEANEISPRPGVRIDHGDRFAVRPLVPGFRETGEPFGGAPEEQVDPFLAGVDEARLAMSLVLS